MTLWDTENTQLRLGQKDSQQHETGLQRKNFKELNNLIGLLCWEDFSVLVQSLKKN